MNSSTILKECPCSSKLESDFDNDKQSREGASDSTSPFPLALSRKLLPANTASSTKLKSPQKFLWRIASCQQKTLLGLNQADNISRRIKRNMLQIPELCRGGLNINIMCPNWRRRYELDISKYMELSVCVHALGSAGHPSLPLPHESCNIPPQFE